MSLQQALTLLVPLFLSGLAIAVWNLVLLGLSDRFGWPSWLGFTLGVAPVFIVLYFFARKLMEG